MKTAFMHPSFLRLPFRLAIIFCLALLSQIGAGLPAQYQMPVGPYLQSPSPNSMVVMWRTNLPCSSRVDFGASPGGLTQSVTDTARVTHHIVKLTGLSPDTRYYYSVYNDTFFGEGGDSTYTFRTFPVAGTQSHVRAWVIGDMGKGNDKQQRVRDSYLDFGNEETDLWLWLGDNVYDDGLESEYLNKVFDSVYGYRGIMKNLPFEPCPGNHDYNTISPVTNPRPPLQHSGPYFDFVEVYRNAEAGGVATGHELFYSFDYGNVHFVCLNSELGSLYNASDDWIGIYLFGNFNGSPMTQWLHQDLTANTQPWTVVYFHQPPYTDGSHDANAFWEVYMQAMRENFAEIWESYGVDLVLCGHSHVYERSYLVKGAYGDASAINSSHFIQMTSGVDSIGEHYRKYTVGPNANQGTVYVVQGNSGSVDDAPAFNHPYMFAEYGCDSCAGSFLLDIDGNRLDGRHLDMNGTVRDHFTIVKYPTTGEAEGVQGGFQLLRIYPNPSDGRFAVEWEQPQSGVVSMGLTAADGKEWLFRELTCDAGPQRYELMTGEPGLPQGIYVMRIRSGSRQAAIRLIIQR